MAKPSTPPRLWHFRISHYNEKVRRALDYKHWPHVRRASCPDGAIIRPPQFSYALPEPWPQELVDLRGSVADRAGFKWVLDIYERHRGTSSEIGARS